MNKDLLPGAFAARKKNGDIYYRATITYRNKHISLGSYETELQAHSAYMTAKSLLNTSESNNTFGNNDIYGCNDISGSNDAFGNNDTSENNYISGSNNVSENNYTSGSNDTSGKIADNITIEDYTEDCPLLFEKWVILINFRDNGIYIKNPIYLKNSYFIYYFNLDEYYLFDIDDLFYYSEHKIMKRNGHLFVADYGMQVNILSRYGIKNYARPGIDYIFKNKNQYDFRLENIIIINSYIGVSREEKKGKTLFLAKLHIRSNYIIGRYKTEVEAAIAYNKAVDIVKSNGCKKNFQTNYIENLLPSQYADIYSRLSISDKIYSLLF